MLATEVLTSPVVLFGLMVAAGWLVYLWASRASPPFRPEGKKTRAYTGGEDIPGQAYRPGYQFFQVALFFTIMHVAALVVATAPRGIVPWGAMVYLAVVALAVLALRWEP